MCPEAGEEAASSHDAKNTEDISVARKVLDRVVTRMGGSKRSGQIRMLEEISSIFETKEHLLIQAGTGTGKSLGYLVPLLTECALRGKRGLVTTATLALQRQIMVKDSPAVVEAVAKETGVTPRVALLKGWSNYLCLHRCHGGYPTGGTLFDVPETGGESEATSDLGREVMRLREWAGNTDTGDRDDLPAGVSDRAWRQVSVQRRECLGRQCPVVEECFPQRARDLAMEADLVVSNHTLLGIHATSETDLFPDIDMVVVDEAHELAERVRDQASCEVSQTSVLRVARQVRTHGGIDVTALENAAIALGTAVENCRDGLLLSRPEDLSAAMAQIDGAVREIASQISSSSAETAAKQLARAACDDLLGTIDMWAHPVNETITWVIRPWRDGDIGAPLLVIAPLNVAAPIARRVLTGRPAVFTSATLALGGSFTTMAQQSGFVLAEEAWRGVDVGTPFCPEQQGILYIASHLPPPGADGPSSEALNELVSLTRAAGGGVLVLFSSWRGVEAGAQALREGTEYDILVHGEDSVGALVSQFRENRDSCLVGTMTFWQGVDVVGPSCRMVVIDRIPFPRPDDPVAIARSRDAERAGLNGFRTVHLTYAALMMAQGSGRLLRSMTDQGVVAVLDQRLVSKNYGAFIRASMPPFWTTESGAQTKKALGRLYAGLENTTSAEG